MSRKVRNVIVVEAVAIALITGIQSALAAPKGYIDPSTGGMLFQVLAVVVTMASGLVFLFSNKIKMLFNRGGNTETAVTTGTTIKVAWPRWRGYLRVHDAATEIDSGLPFARGVRNNPRVDPL